MKTGKIEHPVTQTKKIKLIGGGHEFLWTKNALERSGYSVNNAGSIVIEVLKDNDELVWILAGSERLKSLQALLQQPDLKG